MQISDRMLRFFDGNVRYRCPEASPVSSDDEIESISMPGWRNSDRMLRFFRWKRPTSLFRHLILSSNVRCFGFSFPVFKRETSLFRHLILSDLTEFFGICLVHGRSAALLGCQLRHIRRLDNHRAIGYCSYLKVLDY